MSLVGREEQTLGKQLQPGGIGYLNESSQGFLAKTPNGNKLNCTYQPVASSLQQH